MVNLLRFNSNWVSWQLAADWSFYLQALSFMKFRVSHIYREGNGFADRLAKEGASMSGFKWWNATLVFCNS